MSMNETFENLKRYIEHEIRAYETFGKDNNASLASLRDRCFQVIWSLPIKRIFTGGMKTLGTGGIMK